MINSQHLSDAVANDAFAVAVDSYVVSAVNNGAESFPLLLKALPGIWPPTVLASLFRLSARGLVAESTASRFREEARGKGQTMREPAASNSRAILQLPVAHPLDYEWCFSQSALDYLLSKISAKVTEDSQIALLGTPSVLPAAMAKGLKGQWILLDANRAMVDRLKGATAPAMVSECDVTRDLLPPIAASIVIADPPWYPEYFHSFLWAAGMISQPGASWLFSLPPLGTRPGLEAERQAFLSEAAAMGAVCKSLETGVLPYETPLFEANALRIAGINAVPLEWRRGDLVILSCAAPVKTPRPQPPDLERWEEFAIKGTRWRVRANGNTPVFDPSLVRLLPGDVLPSVSRRDVRRHKADVWTSGNRIFGCQDWQTLSTILQSLSSGLSTARDVIDSWGRTLLADERMSVIKVIEDVMEIVHMEQHERSLFEGIPL